VVRLIPNRFFAWVRITEPPRTSVTKSILYTALRRDQASVSKHCTRRHLPHQDLALAQLRTNMAADYQTSLNTVLEAFKGEVVGALDGSSQRMRQELRALQSTLERYYDVHFAAVEKNLSVPFSRTLPWDWVSDPDPYYDLDIFLDTRQLRYRGDPSFVVTATQYYLKYCPANADILRELGAAGGFYVPAQSSKMFTKMGRDVIERTKRLLHMAQVVKSGIPTDQVDLAWAKEAPRGLEDLMPFIPGPAPVTKTEKEYYLDIANTVRGGLVYTPVKELTETEVQHQDFLRQQLHAFTDQLAQLHKPCSAPQLQQWGTWEIDVTPYLSLHQDMERKLAELEARGDQCSDSE